MEEIAANPERRAGRRDRGRPGARPRPRDVQAAILDATIEVWTGPAQEARGFGAIEPADWEPSIDVPRDARPRPEPGHGRRRHRHRPAAGARTDAGARWRPAERRRAGRGGCARPSPRKRPPSPHLAAAAPPLRGTTTADVVIVGGGYTGLWTALPPDRAGARRPGRAARGGHLRRRPVRAQRRVRHELVGRVPDAHRALRRRAGAHRPIGGGDRGRRRRGRRVLCRARRRRLVHEGRVAVGERRAGPGRWLGRRPWPRCASTAWATASCRSTADEVRARVALAGVPRRRVHAGRGHGPAGGARPRPAARPARARRDDPRGHDAPSRSTASGRAGWVASGAGDAPRAAPPWLGRRTATRAGPDDVRRSGMARSWRARAVLALNAWAAAWPWFGPRLVTWSSYIVLTEPIPDRLADIGWTGGEGVADGRFTLHYLRTTPDGRIAIGGGGGRAGFAGRIGRPFTDSAADAAGARPRDCVGCSRRCATCASRTPGAARSTSAPTTCRGSGRVRGRPIHYGHGYSGNGVGPSVVGGRILAARAVERADDPALALAARRRARRRGRSRRSRRGTSARGSSARRPCGARPCEERGEEPGSAPPRGRVGCPGGSATTWARNSADSPGARRGAGIGQIG